MRVVFVCNQHKTVFYSALAKALHARGVHVAWIALSRRWTDYLKGEGWPADDILNLAEFGPQWQKGAPPTPEQWARIERIDATAEVGLRHALLVDRVWNKRPGRESLAWLATVIGPIEDFLNRHQVVAAFGEVTWAIELLVAEIIRHHGGKYLFHTTIRIPSSRTALFAGVLHQTIEPVGSEPDASHREQARAAISAVRDRGEKPFYLSMNQRPHRLRPHWLGEARIALFRRGDNAFDHTVPELGARIARRLAARWRSRWLPDDLFETAPVALKPYVLVALQKQPEASVDVAGYPAANQSDAIRHLSRLLPAGWEIWVKEHSVALGDRPLSWYRDLQTIPGVRLISPHLDSHGLIRQAALVAAVSGTIAFEAGVLGIPAITFGPLYFAPALLRTHLIPAAMTRDGFRAVLSEADSLRHSPVLAERVEYFVAWMIANSVEAMAVDPISAPRVLEQGNLDRLCELMVGALARDAGDRPGAQPA